MGNILARCKYGNIFLKKKRVNKSDYFVDGIPIGVEYRIYNRGSKTISRTNNDTGTSSATQHKESRSVWHKRVRKHGDDCHAMKDVLDNDKQRIRSSIQILKSEGCGNKKYEKKTERTSIPKSEGETETDYGIVTDRRSSTCNPDINFTNTYLDKSRGNANGFIEKINNNNNDLYKIYEEGIEAETNKYNAQYSKHDDNYYYDDQYTDNYNPNNV